jgi:hypothetical protein
MRCPRCGAAIIWFVGDLLGFCTGCHKYVWVGTIA